MFVVYYSTDNKPLFTEIPVHEGLVIYHHFIVPYQCVWAIPGTLDIND